MATEQPAEMHIPPKPREALEDRKLLDRPSRNELLQSESWRVLRITSEFVAGFDHLAEVYPAVSIFGSARTQLANEYYDAAVKTAELCGKAGFAVITGGGPGIMVAANNITKEDVDSLHLVDDPARVRDIVCAFHDQAVITNADEDEPTPVPRVTRED